MRALEIPDATGPTGAGKADAPKSRAPVEDHWFEIPGAMLSQYGVIRLREQPGRDVFQILQALRDGSFDRPFVLDDGQIRSLHFDLNSVQSEMDIRDPAKLLFAYTRKMMAFLLFRPEPEHVVIVGLGGGSLTRFCHQQLPHTRVTTVEIDENVIGLSELFSMPAPTARSQIVHADAARYFASVDDPADVVLIDGCDRWGTAPAFRAPSFYDALRERLRPGGVLVVNLIGDSELKAGIARTVEAAFPGRCLQLSVRAGGNRLLFAFNDLDAGVDWHRVQDNARKLADIHGLDFPKFAQRLRRSATKMPGDGAVIAERLR